jgi:hypothetical protein
LLLQEIALSMQLTNVTLIIHEYLFQERTRAHMQLKKKGKFFGTQLRLLGTGTSDKIHLKHAFFKYKLI